MFPPGVVFVLPEPSAVSESPLEDRVRSRVELDPQALRSTIRPIMENNGNDFMTFSLFYISNRKKAGSVPRQVRPAGKITGRKSGLKRPKRRVAVENLDSNSVGTRANHHVPVKRLKLVKGLNSQGTGREGTLLAIGSFAGVDMSMND